MESTSESFKVECQLHVLPTSLFCVLASTIVFRLGVYLPQPLFRLIQCLSSNCHSHFRTSEAVDVNDVSPDVCHLAQAAHARLIPALMSIACKLALQYKYVLCVLQVQWLATRSVQAYL